MKLNEVATLLKLSREQTVTAIEEGLALPKSGRLMKLAAKGTGFTRDIDEADLEVFIKAFEAEEPGRHPPAAVRRSLLVEARHRCAICQQPLPLQYHHLIDWAKLKHHDVKQMLAICGGCHDMCTIGKIDHKSQIEYKQQLGAEIPEQKLDQRTQSDYTSLKILFQDLHTWTINNFLQNALENVVIGDALVFWEGFNVKMQAVNIHIYDEQLRNHFDAFYDAWKRCLDHPEDFRPIGGDRFRFTIAFGDDAAERRNQQFLRAVHDATEHFRDLFAYVRENYPEFDVDESDRQAWNMNAYFLG